MNKEQFMRSYAVISLLAGVYFLIATLLYQSNFTTEIYAIVETTLFRVELADFFDTVVVFNLPIVAYAVVFVINAIVAFAILPGLETEKQPLKEVAFYNLVFSFVLILGQIAFVFLIPDRINGVPRDLVLFTEFPITSQTLVRAVNINYFVLFAYLVYNLLVLVQTGEPKEEEIDPVEEEENLLAEFLKD